MKMARMINNKGAVIIAREPRLPKDDTFRLQIRMEKWGRRLMADHYLDGASYYLIDDTLSLFNCIEF
jgi:hypothetical protein